jgi:O-antigen ligase
MITEQQRSTILSVSFWIWCGLLSFPLMLTSDSESANNPTALYYLLQLVGFLQYSIVVILVYPWRILNQIFGYDRLQIAVMAIFFLSLALQLHGESAAVLAGIAYTVTQVIAIVIISLIWTMQADAVARCLGGAAVVFLMFGITAVALFGWPEGRHVGGIHPNFFGSVLLVAFVFSQFWTGRAMFLLRVVCLVLVGAVSSRFAVIGSVIALVIFEATFKPVSLRIVVLTVLAGTCVVLFHDQLNDVLALDDPARNMDSGFSGREDQWNAAFDAMLNHPFGVGFKRPALEEGGGGHNGYLKALLEFGVLGGGLVIAAMFGIVVLAVVKAALHSEVDDRLRRIGSARAAGLGALAFASFFQPQIFNLGDVHGISFSLLLFAPGLRSGRQAMSTGQPVRPIGIGAGR